MYAEIPKASPFSKSTRMLERKFKRLLELKKISKVEIKM